MINKSGRRAAERAGFIASKKSRRGYMLLDAVTRACVVGMIYPPRKLSPGSTGYKANVKPVQR